MHGNVIANNGRSGSRGEESKRWAERGNVCVRVWGWGQMGRG